VLRTADTSLDALTACEADVRRTRGGRLVQQRDVQVDGDRGVRLVFRGGSYAPGRFDLLYVVDTGTYRWAFDFTVAGVQPGAMHQFDSIMLLTVRFPPG
jgi:hypothetical protein